MAVGVLSKCCLCLYNLLMVLGHVTTLCKGNVIVVIISVMLLCRGLTTERC